MCLVEIEKIAEAADRLQHARAPTGMVVAHEQREDEGRAGGVLEFLLINHPLDCPVCDQAGECKLQDYYMDYDRQRSRLPLEDEGPQGEGDPDRPAA